MTEGVLTLCSLCLKLPLVVQVREQQAQQAGEAQAAELRELLRGAAEEASDLRAQLATVVPRDQLTAAESRIKVRHLACCFCVSGYPKLVWVRSCVS